MSCVCNQCTVSSQTPDYTPPPHVGIGDSPLSLTLPANPAIALVVRADCIRCFAVAPGWSMHIGQIGLGPQTKTSFTVNRLTPGVHRMLSICPREASACRPRMDSQIISFPTTYWDPDTPDQLALAGSEDFLWKVLAPNKEKDPPIARSLLHQGSVQMQTLGGWGGGGLGMPKWRSVCVYVHGIPRRILTDLIQNNERLMIGIIRRSLFGAVPRARH